MKATVQLLAALERAPDIVTPLVRQAHPDVLKRQPGEWQAFSWMDQFRHLALHHFHHAYRIEELLLRKDRPAPLFG
jgi:hypothetical protein